MNKVEQIKFKGKKRTDKGFEIIPLKYFFESFESECMEKQFRTDYYNMVFVTSGTCVNEVDFKEYVVSSGELLVISSNRVHRFSAYDNIDGFLISFTEGFLCEYLSVNSTEVKDLFTETYMNPHIKSTDLYVTLLTKLFDAIHYAYTNLSTVMNYEVISTTVRSLAQLIGNIGIEEKSSNKLNNELFLQFTKLVEKYIDTEKTVEAYAKMMHVSQKTVNVTTRKAVDISAKQYIIQQLILKIKLKLCFEQKSISEISNELGFSESNNMTKFFKKYTESTPKEFRINNRDNTNYLIKSENLDLDAIKESIEENVYYVPSDRAVPLHKHKDLDEIFYCIKGSGFGVLEDREVALSVGTSFTVTAGTMHSLRSDGELYVSSFLVPVVDERELELI